MENAPFYSYSNYIFINARLCHDRLIICRRVAAIKFQIKFIQNDVFRVTSRIRLFGEIDGGEGGFSVKNRPLKFVRNALGQ